MFWLHYCECIWPQGSHGNEADQSAAGDAGLGFDDPFFQQDVPMATTGKEKKRQRKKIKDGEEESQQKVNDVDIM